MEFILNSKSIAIFFFENEQTKIHDLPLKTNDSTWKSKWKYIQYSNARYNIVKFVIIKSICIEHFTFNVHFD